MLLTNAINQIMIVWLKTNTVSILHPVVIVLFFYNIDNKTNNILLLFFQSHHIHLTLSYYTLGDGIDSSYYDMCVSVCCSTLFLWNQITINIICIYIYYLWLFKIYELIAWLIFDGIFINHYWWDKLKLSFTHLSIKHHSWFLNHEHMTYILIKGFQDIPWYPILDTNIFLYISQHYFLENIHQWYVIMRPMYIYICL